MRPIVRSIILEVFENDRCKEQATGLEASFLPGAMVVCEILL